MNNDDTLKEMINMLVESIQSSIQNSQDILDILDMIEEHGYKLNLSVLIGILLRDKEGQDIYFSSVSGEDAPEIDEFLRRELMKHSDFDKQPIQSSELSLPPQGSWTDNDIQFLESLGIKLDTN